MRHIAWWAFWGAFIVGIPMLLIDSRKSPKYEAGFKVYMALVLVWNIGFTTYKIRQKRQARKEA